MIKLQMTTSKIKIKKPADSESSPVFLFSSTGIRGGGGERKMEGSEIRFGYGKTAQGKTGCKLFATAHFPELRVTRVICRNIYWFFKKNLSPKVSVS